MICRHSNTAKRGIAIAHASVIGLFLALALCANALLTAHASADSKSDVSASAEASETLLLGSSTTMEETTDGNVKQVKVKNEGKNPCFVRVRAFASEEGPSAHALEYSGKCWMHGEDGWLYFQHEGGSALLGGNEATDDLQIEVKDASEGSESTYDVVVVYETTLVSNADGTRGDWDGAQSIAEAREA